MRVSVRPSKNLKWFSNTFITVSEVLQNELEKLYTKFVFPSGNAQRVRGELVKYLLLNVCRVVRMFK